MELMTKDERQKLIKLLLTLPNVNDPATRRLLLANLPRKLQDSIPFSDVPSIHVNIIVDSATNEAWRQLRDGSLTIRIVIENAVEMVEGSWLAGDLEALSGTLIQRHAQQVVGMSDLTFTPQKIDEPLPVLISQQNAIRQITNSIPDQIRLLDLLQISDPDTADIWGMWHNRDATDYLRIPIGQSAGATSLYLSLQDGSPEGGAHGLIGGTTGSGKSELLRTMICAFAATHHPDQLNFVLIDYKGGNAFHDLETLPHVVSYVTNLDEHLAERVLLSLRSELKRRQWQLGNERLGSVAAYQQSRDREPARGLAPIPNLVIVIDEFAQLKEELVDFIQGLISIARVGRSLGFHLLLATQRPAGVITTYIRTSADYKISLRVVDASDSYEVIGSPDAALFLQGQPGRGFIQIGTDSPVAFQAAQVTKPYKQPHQTGASAATNQWKTDLESLVHRIVTEAVSHNIPDSPAPWLPPLPQVVGLQGVLNIDALTDDSLYNWPDQPPYGWMTTNVGLLDDPAHQRQNAFRLNLSEGGHVLVFGKARSGKSTFLRTAAVALAATHTPADLQLYCLDFGRNALRPLRELPHCGDVLYSSDVEKILRLVADLRRAMTQRAQDMQQAHITDFAQYRRHAGQTHVESYIVVLIDNFEVFRAIFLGEDLVLSPDESEELLTDLMKLIREGPAVGIHFLISTDSWRAIGRYPAIVSAIGLYLALQQADNADYSYVGLRVRGNLDLPPGRGFLGGSYPLEVQIAVPTQDHAESYSSGLHAEVFEQIYRRKPLALEEGILLEQTSSEEQISALSVICRRFRKSWKHATAPAVRQLPQLVRLKELINVSVAGATTQQEIVRAVRIGLEDQTLQPLQLELHTDNSRMLVSGPTESGKSTLLVSLILGLAESYAPQAIRFAVIAFRRSPLQHLVDLPHMLHPLARTPDELDALVNALDVELDERQGMARTNLSRPSLVVIVDDLEEVILSHFDSPSRLLDVARRGRALGLVVVAAGLSEELLRSYDDFTGYLRRGQTGILLSPNRRDAGDLFEVHLPPLSRRPFPPGRGFFLRRRAWTALQVATVMGEEMSLDESVKTWVHQIRTRYSSE